MTDLDEALKDLDYGYEFSIVGRDGVRKYYSMYDANVTRYYVEGNREASRGINLKQIMKIVENQIANEEVNPHDAGFRMFKF